MNAIHFGIVVFINFDAIVSSSFVFQQLIYDIFNSTNLQFNSPRCGKSVRENDIIFQPFVISTCMVLYYVPFHFALPKNTN